LCGEFLKNDVEIWKESLHRSHPMLNGKLYKTWKIFDAQLMHQSAAVCFYGFGRKKEITCDLSAGFTFNNELKYLSFTWAESFDRTLLRIGYSLMNVVFDYCLRDAVG
jgi:hypothetical protein